MTPKSINYSRLPEHIRGGAQRYIENGIRPGDFQQAVISNKLKESFFSADEINQERMLDIILFWYNEAPGPCWGSPEKMETWIEAGGWYGEKKPS